jgi:hypothetical protein
MPSANDNDFALRFWETYLNAGYHVAATGGSDNHWRSTTAAQGVGQPTTWVYVTKPGVAGVIEGIRAGRTTISHLPPALGGPQLFLEADGDNDGVFEAMPGSTVPHYAGFRVRAENRVPGAIYRIVTNKGERGQVAPEQVFTFDAETKWVRIELLHPDARTERTDHCDPLVGGETTYCHNRLVVEALTSPIYIG